MSHEKCEHFERVVELEKEVTELKTKNQHYNLELKEIKKRLEDISENQKESTKAINRLCNEMAATKGSRETVRWLLTFGIALISFIAGKFVLK